jgi:Dolichyl-phosphate-mannose-protein mannosyltransferase
MRLEVAEPEIEAIRPEQSRGDLRLRYFCYATLVIVLVIFAMVRIRLRNTPLERDEGEYAYAGQLMLEGYPPYQLAYNMKLPGTCAAYAVMMTAFGQTVAGIRIGMMIVLIVNTLLVFFLGRRLFGILAGSVAAAAYTLMANRLSTMSLDGHATHFIVLMALAGTLLLLHAIDTQRRLIMFGSGLCFGLAFLMKQHGILFAVFGFFFWAWSEWKQNASWRRLIRQGSILVAGMILPFLVTCFIVWRGGAFGQFWFWTVRYGAAYEKILKLPRAWALLQIMLPWVPRPVVIWLMAAFGLTAVFWNRQARRERVFLLSFTLFSILAVVPGFYFRPHYFLVVLPAAALLAGLGISAAYEYLQEREASTAITLIPVAFFVLSYVAALQGQRRYLFQMDPIQVNRQMHAKHGFPEAEAVADYITVHSSDQDRIALLGSEPEIYFYSKRRSATGYIYMYPLLENQPFAQQMKNDMIREIETSQPKIIVFVDNQLSWGWELDWDDSDPRMNIFTWIRSYLDAHYDLMAEVPIDGATHDVWGAPCRYYIFRRR